jgi:hypothetical protein
VIRLLPLLLLAACAQSFAERCQEAKDIVASFNDPTAGEYALAVAACVP